MEAERDRLVKKVYKDDRPTEILAEDLTREEAIAMVKEDIEENPDCEEYMVVFDYM